MNYEWQAPEFLQCGFGNVDLLLEDGSTLMDCIPQMDGDVWWNGAGPELFVDPKYCVKAWRYHEDD